MGDIAIKVENLHKQYRLGHVGSRTLTHDLNRWWHSIIGKDDPYLKIGQQNDRTRKGNSDYVWALQDISFEVLHGEAVGVIGRNGAGKSTLLKLLSKITSPTKGCIKLNGRIASLLEVGTGFHPDLSGRDNIYLNGAILGMTRREIASQFDSIVDFAGVERYIDTPVKRYSSGMYVRLAFAVAAHLNPEILIVDEVLAVGDAEFQKKCLGKMKSASEEEGRTVLFVSHQMDAIRRLCTKTLVLENGFVSFWGSSEKGINYYQKGAEGSFANKKWGASTSKPGNENVRLLEVKAHSNDGLIKESFYAEEDILISIIYEILRDNFVYTHGFNLFDSNMNHLFTSHDAVKAKNKTPSKPGAYRATVRIPANLLAEGVHQVGVAIMSYDPYIVHFNESDAIFFSVIDSNAGSSARGNYGGKLPGLVRPLLTWETSSK